MQQHVLFSGMNCLPGQQDLFPTDGKLSEELRSSDDKLFSLSEVESCQHSATLSDSQSPST